MVNEIDFTVKIEKLPTVYQGTVIHFSSLILQIIPQHFNIFLSQSFFLSQTKSGLSTS